jgi:hypothetical protein
MESKNDWFLINARKVEIKELNEVYWHCIYSNGLKEIELSRQLGKDIPTILENDIVVKSLSVNK